ncbi:glycosylhydrolase-like jelly roll fold domain-containing protein [Persicitalea jodogahamensis]|uniref:Beta-mannosidase-like galactose-binding domain-containing protein n=1 Tax=Persicitalea jodogahamensis TaxID=402147 RepID=A0A8J3DA23_9BACT|nr:glycosylhydrolase-like jelly roll fold domain-containing protein [Persicitalea jodogahamensis]GHB74885.1 hypothetical protein GCM10007390_30710 [Persicitalea jodogahamensis]
MVGATGHIPAIHYTTEGFYSTDAQAIEVKSGTGTLKSSPPTGTITLSGDWDLTFPPKWGAPEKVTIPKLISWTESADKGIWYFSGIASYQKSFEYTKAASGNRIYLDLGELAEVAEVWVNDAPLGITWTKPHRFDITKHLRGGGNRLRIEVANTWSNRLTGDALTGEKFTNTNIVKANKNLTPWGEVPLKNSGLLGPVTISTVKPTKP